MSSTHCNRQWKKAHSNPIENDKQWRKRITCKHYMSGGCNRGKKCWFNHALASNDSIYAAIINGICNLDTRSKAQQQRENIILKKLDDIAKATSAIQTQQNQFLSLKTEMDIIKRNQQKMDKLLTKQMQSANKENKSLECMKNMLTSMERKNAKCNKALQEAVMALSHRTSASTPNKNAITPSAKSELPTFTSFRYRASTATEPSLWNQTTTESSTFKYDALANPLQSETKHTNESFDNQTRVMDSENEYIVTKADASHSPPAVTLPMINDPTLATATFASQQSLRVPLSSTQTAPNAPSKDDTEHQQKCDKLDINGTEDGPPTLNNEIEKADKTEASATLFNAHGREEDGPSSTPVSKSASAAITDAQNPMKTENELNAQELTSIPPTATSKANKVENKTRAQQLKVEGNELFKKKQYQNALEAYRAAQQLDPNEPTLVSNESAALYYMEEWDQFISCFDRLLDMKPDKVLADKGKKRMNDIYRKRMNTIYRNSDGRDGLYPKEMKYHQQVVNKYKLEYSKATCF